MIRLLGADELEANAGRLVEILCDAVDAGAGVSFLRPLSEKEARDYWLGLKPAVESGKLMLLVAEVDGVIAGTVQLHKAWPPNQPHRGEIAKLLVHRQYQRQKLGSRLMQAAEAKAREMGVTLINFDAVAHGPVEKFYRDLGFTYVGIIPGYAYSGDNELVDTAIFYKQLA